DPLHFVDDRPFVQKLAQARARTGLSDAVVAVSGTIGGQPVVAAVMDFRFLGGSLGCAVGEAVAAAADLARAQRVPLLLVTASGRPGAAAATADGSPVVATADGGAAADNGAGPAPAWLLDAPDQLAERDPWQVVQLARHPGRPTTLDYLERAFDHFDELHGDR